MTTVKPLAIKLDAPMQARLKVLAAAKDRSTHYLLREAVAQFIEREERQAAYRAAGMAAWEAYQATGQHVAHEAADAWLAQLEAGQPAPMPKWQD